MAWYDRILNAADRALIRIGDALSSAREVAQGVPEPARARNMGQRKQLRARTRDMTPEEREAERTRPQREDAERRRRNREIRARRDQTRRERARIVRYPYLVAGNRALVEEANLVGVYSSKEVGLQAYNQIPLGNHQKALWAQNPRRFLLYKYNGRG